MMRQKEKDNGFGAYVRTQQTGDKGRCGFVTGTHYEINQYGNNDMTIAQSKALFERLREDELFRNRILGADNLDECMKIVELNGYDCSTDEVQMALNKYTSDNTSDSCGNFTLWGNRIPG
ncbi:Nif11-like leader peptide family natural product precursor [Chlorobium limicola]